MIYWYFGILIVLATLSQAGFLAIYYVFPPLGLPLLVSTTLLLYSLLLLPFFLRPRLMMRKPLLAAVAVVPFLVVTVGIPLFAQSRRDAFIAHQTQEDLDSDASIPSVHVIAFIGTRSTTLNCSDLCERLLYNREVESVVKIHADNSKQETVAYHVEQRTVCETGPGAPAPYSTGAQKRQAAGECIVVERGANPETVDVTVADQPLYYNDGRWRDLREDFDRFLFSLESAERITIAAGGPHNGKLLVRHTMVAASAPAMPLYFHLGGEMFSANLVLARDSTQYSSRHIEALLKQKLGFRLVDVLPR